MTERHDDPASRGRPISTGEFRAAPDISASTAQFRAFAEDSAEPGRAWDMAARPGRSPARLTALIAGVVVVLAIIVIVATLG